MLVSSFLAWFERATPRERAEAVDMLAHAYLAGALDGESPEAAEAALTLVLDDPARMVRRTLACAFAEALQAPRHIILALATDHPEIAAPVLARSPVLQDADLIDMATTAEPRALLAMALRHHVSGRLAQALIARHHRDTALALAGNAGAEISDADLLAMAVAFGRDGAVRETLLARGALPSAVRHQLMLALSETLGTFVTEGGFLAKPKSLRALQDALQQGTVAIAANARDDLAAFVGHLRESAQLTPGLLLRSVLGGDTRLLTEALAQLSELPVNRVASLMNGRADATLAALFRRAGLPDFLQNPLIAAVRAAQELSTQEFAVHEAGYTLCLPVIRAAQAGCLSLNGGEDVRLLALLRRYEAEAARAQSRKLGESLREQAQSDLALLTLTDQQASEMVLLAAGEPVPVVSEPEPAPVDPLPEEIPDLRTVIAEWKRERETRHVANMISASPVLANQPLDFSDWEIRRSVA